MNIGQVVQTASIPYFFNKERGAAYGIVGFANFAKENVPALWDADFLPVIQSILGQRKGA
jgi:hypothetical protein